MEDLEAFLKRYHENIRLHQLEDLDKMLANEFLYFTDQCVKQTKPGFLELLAKDDWVMSNYQISELDWQFSEDGEMALARYVFENNGCISGMGMCVFSRESLLAKKIAGRWQIVHSHSSARI